MALYLIDTPETLFTASAKNDTVSIGPDATSVTVKAGEKNDVIWNRAEYAYIDGEAGNDTVNNYYLADHWDGDVGGHHSTLTGGAGDDSVYNSCEAVSVNGGEGNDIITNEGKNVTMNGGAGNDEIKVGPNVRIFWDRGNMIEYSAGDGNDVLINYTADDTIRILDGSIVGGYRGVGSNDLDVVLQISNGKKDGTLTLKNGATLEAIGVIYGDDPDPEDLLQIAPPLNETFTESGAYVSGGLLNDYIDNRGSEAIVEGGGGADYIVNVGDGSSIAGGAGADTIYNTGNDATLDGDAGDDFISNLGENVSMSGGEGADVLYNGGENTTVFGGAGDDTITVGAGTVIEYANGNGNDVIFGCDENSTIRFTSGSPVVSTDGLDVIITVGKGTLTIKDAVGKTLNWTNAKGKLTSKVYGDFDVENSSEFATVNGTAKADKIYNSGDIAIVSGGAGADTIKNEGSYVSISGGAGNDYINDRSWGSSTISGGAGNDTIELANDAWHVIEYAAGEGKDVIIGYGETDSIKLTKGTIVSSKTTISGDDVIFTIGTGTLTIKDGSGKLITFIDANDEIISSERYGPANIENAEGYASIVTTEYNDTITNWAEGATIRGGAGADYVENYGEGSKLYGDGGADTLLNYGDNSTLEGGADADYIDNVGDGVRIYGNAGADYIQNSGRKTTISGGAGNDTFIGSEYGELYIFNAGEGNDVITNFDVNDTLKITSGRVAASMTPDNTKDLIVTVKSSSATGTVTFRNFDKAIEFKTDGDGIDLIVQTNEYEEINNETKGALVSGTDGKDYIYNVAEQATLRPNGGNDTLDGSDAYGEVFQFNPGEGDNVIVNFGDNDTLQALSGAFASSVIAENGKDVLITIEAADGDYGTILLKDAADKTFKSVSNKLGNFLTVVTTNKIKNTKNDIPFSGTDAPDYMTNTGNNVTINGGIGNDTIAGSSYGELIQFGADGGQDVVTDFGANDTIQIVSGEVQSHMKNGNDYVFNVKGGAYSGSITLKNKGDRKFKIDGNLITLTDEYNVVRNDKDGVLVEGETGNEGRDYIYNSGSNVTIAPGKGDDTIYGSNFGEVFSFAYNNGNNVITNFDKLDTVYASSGSISATAKSGNDFIITIANSKKTSLSTVTLKNLSSDITLVQSDNKIYAAPGYNIIDETGSKITIKGLSTNEGKDLITSTGSKVTIIPGSGNDTITGSDLYADLYRFSSSDDSNIITNFGKGDSLQFTESKGTMSTAKSGSDMVVTLKGTKTATVTLENLDSDLKLITVGNNIYAESVNTLDNDKDGVKVTGSGGIYTPDLIYNTGNNVTIQPNAGDDTIIASEAGIETFLIGSAHGNNLIENFSVGDTLKLTDKNGTMTTVVSGDDVIVTLTGSSSGILTLAGAADENLETVKSGKYMYLRANEPLPYNVIENYDGKHKVEGSLAAHNGDDSIVNYGDNVTIAPGKGNDTIDSNADGAELFQFAYTNGNNIINDIGVEDSIQITSGTLTTARSGNDLILSIAKKTTVSTVTLKDFSKELTLYKEGSIYVVRPDINTIENDRSYTLVSGTDGRDYVVNTGEGVTIDGNGGDDTIEGSNLGETYLFDAIDGNDVLTDFDENDVLRIMSGTVTSAKNSGKNYVVTVSQAAGKETLTGTVTIIDGKNKIGQHGNQFVMKDVVKTIKNSKNKVNEIGTAFDDYIINTGSNVTINGKGGNDTIEGSNAYGELIQFGADGGQDLVKNFGKNDTLQIVSGAIQSTLRAGNDVIVNVKNSAYAGAIVLGGAAGYKLKTTSDGNAQYLVIDSINQTVNDKDDYTFKGTSKADFMSNSGAGVTIAPGKGNDTIEGSNFGDMYTFAYNTGANVITNFGANDTLKSTGGTISTQKSGNDVIVSITKSSSVSTVTLMGASAAGYKFAVKNSMLYVNNITPYDETDDNIPITGSTKSDYITSTGKNVTITPGKGNDTITGSDEYGDLYQFAYNTGADVITNFGKGDTLKATSGSITAIETVGNDIVVSIAKKTTVGTVTLKDAVALKHEGYTLVQNGAYITLDSVNEIVNDYDNRKITGGSGRDYIINTAENVSIAPGKGNDTIDGSVFAETYLFAYTYGSNVITNFGVEDTLKSTSGDLSFQKSGKDMVATITKGKTSAKVTLQGAGAYKFVQSDDGSAMYVDKINQVYNDQDRVAVTTSSGADYVVNTGEKVTITGSKGADTITGSDEYGELFNFAYTNGNNVITNFGKGDTLQATSGTLTYEKSGSDYVVTIANGSKKATVTLSGAADLGTLQANPKKTALILRTNVVSESKQLTASAEDYWFTEDETIADASYNEVDALMSEAAVGEALGKANFNASEMLTSLDGVSKLEKTLAIVERHKMKK